MNNPWNDVPLEVYESHMSLDSVAQLQALNRIMGEQVKAYPDAESAAVIGVAGGNGLEYFGERFKAVYAIDINSKYLEVCAHRFGPSMGERLKLVEADISKPETALPMVDLIIADLLIEYVGIEKFCSAVSAAQARNVSCVIQNTGSKRNFVSESPYQAELQGIGALHCDIEESDLTAGMAGHGYGMVYREAVDMPNGKRLIRLDYTAVCAQKKA